MESVELKEKSKTKRIKHSFPRREVFHRWIHSPEYCYTNSNQRYKVSGFEDWLLVGDFGKTYVKTATKEQVINDWNYWRKDYCIAVINREKKLILVNTTYDNHYYDLMNSIPDDYEIFKTNETITRADILSTGGLSDVLHLHAKYLIKTFIQTWCVDYYAVLSGIKKTCHSYYTDVFAYKADSLNNYVTTYSNIVDFVKKYKIKKESWYNETVVDKTYLFLYKGWSKQHIKVTLPNIKQIITKKIFTNKEILFIKQKTFYSNYCYGFNISFKTVQDNWKSSITKDEFIELGRKLNHVVNWDTIETKPTTWCKAVEIIRTSYDKSIILIEKNNRSKAKENYRNALAEVSKISNSEDSINNWRENKGITSSYITFRDYVPSTRNKLGYWKDERIRVEYTFSNIQLLLRNDRITTSRYATVPLDAAVKMWKMFKIVTKDKPCEVGKPIMIRLEDKNVKVGIYNLRAIQYNQKKTDDGKLLDKWEWCVVIGCHYLWIDDFINFIDYYNLYTLFNIVNNDNKVNDNKVDESSYERIY